MFVLLASVCPFLGLFAQSPYEDGPMQEEVHRYFNAEIQIDADERARTLADYLDSNTRHLDLVIVAIENDLPLIQERFSDDPEEFETRKTALINALDEKVAENQSELIRKRFYIYGGLSSGAALVGAAIFAFRANRDQPIERDWGRMARAGAKGGAIGGACGIALSLIAGLMLPFPDARFFDPNSATDKNSFVMPPDDDS